MEHSQTRIQSPIVNPERFGVSFSLKQCRDFKIESSEALTFLLEEVGFRRFRLMSYWNEHEQMQGSYNFDALDQQIEKIAQYNGVITLCLGARQPRWPESHWPEWALKLPQDERYQALFLFIETVVNRYKNHTCIISWQLENEALNRSFGEHGDFNRERLKHEYNLVSYHDSSRPVIMSTSNTWGIPIRQPRPNKFGFTFYQVQFEAGRYSRTKLPRWWWRFRAIIITALTRRLCFIHELQAEPWGPKAIWEMSTEEQDKSMNAQQLAANIILAKKTKLYPIDLWGGEWWYWRHLQNDDSVYKTVQKNLLQEEST